MTLKRQLSVFHILFASAVCAFLMVAVSQFVNPSKAHAATYNVAAGNDANAVDGQCRLVEAFEAITTQAVVNECPAGDGNDTINLPAGTITLTDDNSYAELGTGASLEINGQAGASIIDGDSTYAGFLIVGNITANQDPASFVIENVQFINIAGGNIGVIQTQTTNTRVQNIEISNSTTTSIPHLTVNPGSGVETLDLSVDIDNVYIHDSSSDNSAGIGIWSQGADNGGTVDNYSINADISNVTLTENAAAAGVSGIFFFGSSDGNNEVNATIRNSTLGGGNTDAVGVFSQATPANTGTADINVDIINSTIVGNEFPALGTASGIIAYADSPVGATATVDYTLQNSIIADNTAGGNLGNCGGIEAGFGTSAVTFTSNGNNLSDDNTCGTAQGSDQYNVATVDITSTLGPLQDNGGFAPTMALLAGSPALDAGATVGSVTTDQRGTARPQGSAYDIGAFELVASGPTPDPDSGGGGGGSGGGAGAGGATSSSSSQLANTGENKVMFAALAGLSIAAGLVIVARTALTRRSFFRK